MSYSIITDTVTGDSTCLLKTYGIKTEDGMTIHDITTEYELIKRFTDDLNIFEVAKVHFEDTVNDFISEISTVLIKK